MFEKIVVFFKGYGRILDLLCNIIEDDEKELLFTTFVCFLRQFFMSLSFPLCLFLYVLLIVALRLEIQGIREYNPCFYIFQ